MLFFYLTSLIDAGEISTTNPDLTHSSMLKIEHVCEARAQ